MSNIGRNIMAERVRRNWSRDELARKIGHSEYWLGRVERGEIDPRASDVEALADALGVEIGVLWPTHKGAEQ